MREGATEVQVPVADVQGLHLHRQGRDAALNVNIPLLRHLTGLRIQQHEAVVVLTVHRVEGAAHSQQAVRKRLNRLHLTVDARAEGTAQLAGTHLVSREESLVDLLAASRFDVGKVAAGEDRAAHLGNGLHLGVHLTVLAGTGRLTRTPLPLLGVAIG